MFYQFFEGIHIDVLCKLKKNLWECHLRILDLNYSYLTERYKLKRCLFLMIGKNRPNETGDQNEIRVRNVLKLGSKKSQTRVRNVLGLKNIQGPKRLGSEIPGYPISSLGISVEMRVTLCPAFSTRKPCSLTHVTRRLAF